MLMFFLEPDPVGSWVGGALASRWSWACYKLTKQPACRGRRSSNSVYSVVVIVIANASAPGKSHALDNEAVSGMDGEGAARGQGRRRGMSAYALYDFRVAVAAQPP